MNKKIVYIKDDGKLAVVTPLESTKSESESWREFYERIEREVVPLGARSSIIDAAMLPKDREFRDLWEMDIYDRGGSIKYRDKFLNAIKN